MGSSGSAGSAGSGSGAGGSGAASSSKAGADAGRGSESRSESKESQLTKQPEYLGKAQKEASEGRTEYLTQQIKEQRAERKQRLSPDGKPGDATKSQGGRMELKDGDKTLIPGRKETKLDKSSDGRINKIEYADGTSREVKYAKNGEITEYTARDGSQWKSQDGLRWENQKGGASMTGIMRIESDGTFKFLNAGDGKEAPHLTMTKPDGTTTQDRGHEMIKTVCDIAREGIKSFDKDRNGKVSPSEVEKAIMDPNVTGTRAFAAALIFHTGRDKSDVTTARVTSSEFQNKTAPYFAQLLQAGSRSELKPDDPAASPNSDIVQGAFNDCRFVATMASCAATAEGREALMGMVSEDGKGAYDVKFADNKSVHVNGLTTGEKMLGATSKSDMLYPAVLEKAYGQLRNQEASNDWTQRIQHTAENLFKGQMSPETIIPAAASGYGERDNAAAMQLLTGSNVERVNTNRDMALTGGAQNFGQAIDAVYHPDKMVPQLDQALTEAIKDRKVVTASILDLDLPDRSGGLRKGHEYSILDYNDGQVLLRDPAGKITTDKDSVVRPVENGQNGEFWISIRDFNQRFNDIIIQCPEKEKKRE